MTPSLPFFRNVIRRGAADAPGPEFAIAPPISAAPFRKPDMEVVYRNAKDRESDRDWRGAADSWSEIHDADRGNREALLGLVSALHAQGLYDDAEARLRDASEEHSLHLDYAISHAQNAQLRADLDTAIARSAAIAKRFPEHVYGYATAALLLTAAGRHDEGRKMLAEGRSRFADDPSLLLPSIQLAVAALDWSAAAADLKRLDACFEPAHSIRTESERLRPAIAAGHGASLHDRASEAERARDFRAALESWEALSSLRGANRDTRLGIGRCRRELGLFAAADRAFREAAEASPGDVEIEANIAQVPAMASDWPEAARRWRGVIDAFPENTEICGMAAASFVRAGDRAAAEGVLDRAIARAPALVDLRTARALTAEVAGDWASAVERWDDVMRLAPGDHGFRILHEEARSRLQEASSATLRGSGAAQTSLLERIASFEGDTGIPMKELVKHFENLGDNCEFGVVQRHFGAEPITLFRFAAIDPERLIELLDVELEPLGDPAHTYVSEMMDEYYIKDDRGYYYMHTFVKAKQVDAERYIKQQVPRIAYLKRNFLADLRSGEKTYVCKLSTAQISDDTLRRLSATLRRYGDNLLLGGRRADEDHPVGTVERLDDHILIGYTTPLYGEEDRPLNSASWGKVMKTVYRHRFGEAVPPVAETAS